MSARNLRNRKHPMRNNASVSRISVLSSLTQSSSGSNGSNSTVTQESVLSGKQSSSRQGVSKRSTGQQKRTSKKEPSYKSSVKGKKAEVPDVFTFQTNDGEEEGDAAGHLPSDFDEDSDPDQGIPTNLPAAPQPPISSSLPAVEEMYEQTPARPLSIVSLHSDSGISIRSHSPERQSPVAAQKSPSKPFFEKLRPRSKPMVRGGSSSSIASTSSSTRSAPLQWNGTPESFYPRTPSAGVPSQIKSEKSGKQSTRRVESSKKISKSKTLKPPAKPSVIDDKGGYNFLASQLSATDPEAPKPLYRRFETLNNRILLFLQDEITTMEYDLEMRDQEIARESQPGPTSRRRELQPPGPSPLQIAQIELQGMLMQKLDLYNRALLSYQSLASLPQTSFTETKVYKDFLASTRPVVESEIAFLDYLSDLATITPKRTRAEGDEEDLAMADKSALTAGAAILFTIVVFKLVPNLFARLVVGAAVVGGMVCTGLLPGEIDFGVGMPGREGEDGQAGQARSGELGSLGRRCGVYATAILLLAVAVG